MFKDINSLIHNSWSQFIYGEEDIDKGFIESIKNLGIKEPIVIKDDGTIISGNRRVSAAQKLDFTQVPARIENYETEIEEREAIIEYNRYRKKTFSQKMNEAEFVQETERIKAKQRQQAAGGDRGNQYTGGKVAEVDTCPQPPKSKSRDETAQKTNFGSGRTYDRAKKIWDSAKQGDEKAQEIVNKIDREETSISEGEQEIKKQEKQKEVEQKKQEYSQRVEEAKTNNSTGKIDIFKTIKKFRVIYADPPWEYNLEQTSPQLGGAIKHYDSMSIDDLCALPIKNITEKDAVLFLWITSPKLNLFPKIMDAWGFDHKTSFVWDKVKHNMGHYNSIRHEFLLIGGKGQSTPDVQKLYDSVQNIERPKNHSNKPIEFVDIIDELYVTGDRIELFARKPSKASWYYWGNEV